MSPRLKKMLPALLVALAGVVEIAVALVTLDQTSAVIGVALIVAAIVFGMSARKA